MKHKVKGYKIKGNPNLRYPDVTAHEMVGKLCTEMAQTIYEELASKSDLFYRVNEEREDFVKQCAPTLREEAVSLLAQMLNDDSVSQVEKDQIYKALILDKQLPRTGTSIVRE